MRHRLSVRARHSLGAVAFAGILAATSWPLLASAAHQDKQTAAPLINGAWKLNKAASATGADLSSASGRTAAAAPQTRGRGGRGGGRGGAMGGGMSADQLQKLRALVQDVTTMPDGLTLILDGGTVTFTYDTGQVFHYATSGSEEKQTFAEGSVKVKTTWDGAVLTQHIDAGNNVKLLGTCAVSGDQLVVTFTRDTGDASPATSTDASGNRTTVERRWVYDSAK